MIKIALPNKGQLFEPCLDLLRSCGYKVQKPYKGLSYIDELNEIEFYFLRPGDIPMYVGEGIIDAGITGIDFHAEKKSTALKILDLPFGKSKLCVAALEDRVAYNIDRLNHARIATSFPEITKQFFKGNDIQIVELEGAVEISVSLGIADYIVDIVETGSTLKSAGLKIIGEPLFYSNAALFSNPDRSGIATLKNMAKRLEGRIIALNYQLIEYDVPGRIVDLACKTTPGLESPTITQLKDGDWYSVKSMIEKKDAHIIMDKLHEMGCKAILLTNIETARI